jgi:hypothetical protein
MSTAEVEAKASEYMGAVLGKGRAQRLIEKMRDLEQIADIRALREDITR